jgi:iron complex transport system permease protein
MTLMGSELASSSLGAWWRNRLDRHGAGLALALVLLLASVVLIVLSLEVGSAGWENLLPIFTSEKDNAQDMQILWNIRLPRTIGAWTAGALLGLSGAVAQGLFRNPLADPYLLGSASGASVCVAAALALFGVSPFATEWVVRIGLTGAAFIGAGGAVLLSLMLARGAQHSVRLLLSGLVVGSVLGAIGSLIGSMRPDLLSAMQAFMLGSTGFVTWSGCGIMFAVWASCMLVSWAMSSVLDGLTLGESTAASLGLPLKQMRVVLVAVIALTAGAAVAETGVIVFIGLAAPHLVRSLVKTRHASLLILASLMGAVLLTAADILSRLLIAPQELPVGLLTASLGGVYLLYLMQKRDRVGRLGRESL